MKEKLCPHEQKMNSWAFLLHWGMQKAHVLASFTPDVAPKTHGAHGEQGASGPGGHEIPSSLG